MVVNEQQCPTGVVHLWSLLPDLMTSIERPGEVDRTLPLYGLSTSIVEPLATIPAQLSVEQFGAYLRTHLSTINTGFDWAAVDSEGKFLGLVDSPRLLQDLAISRAMTEERESVERRGLDTLVELLERLPWPLMLQTGEGEVVTQNLAWWQQFSAFSDVEGIRQEVEAILENSFATPTEISNQKSAELSWGVLAALSYSTLRESRHLGTNSAYTMHPEVKPWSALSEVEVPPSVGNSRFESSDAATSSRCQMGSQPGTCICVFTGQNGQERIWQFIKIPLHLSLVITQVDNRQIWLLLATDVTKEQQLASELAAKNADLIQVNRLKDEFLACISHELKTPLTAVLGLSTLLKDQAMGQLNGRQARYARLIHQSGRHLMTVVNDILDLTRMETGQLELTLLPVQIHTVCDRSIQQARSIQIEARQAATDGEPSVENLSNHRFTLSIEPGLDSFVADELRLRQMLVHLLANAFKFTETGGEIGLRVSRWEGWIAFTVWDTGIGIPEHQQHLIFQKFQQLENPLTRRFEGTGLGLVLTRALARLHGGDVSFLSTEGKGSQFTLLLPPSPPCKRAGGAGEAGEQSTPLPTSSGRLVLVVEAAPRFIEDLTEHLTRLGYRFAIARLGTEALEKARRLQPRAVFLNPFLPQLSGWDVLTLLKSDPATSQIPVIMMATRAEREQAFLNRADDFLSLPVQQQVLQQLLARFCVQTQIAPPGRGVAQNARNETPLTILRLVNGHPSTPVLESGCQSHASPTGVVTTEGTPTGNRLKSGDPNARHLRRETLLQRWLTTALPSATRSLLNGGNPTPVTVDCGRPSCSAGSHMGLAPQAGVPRHGTGSPSPLNYRVLEVDDLEQAELLARIWRPDVVLLDAEIPDPIAYLKQLSQHPSLKSLPLVTLDLTTTQAANQVTGLSIFPCLTPAQNRSIDTLLPVLEIAAGIGCKPSLLLVDIAKLPDLADTSLSLRSEWFQALIQYLHTAGFRSMMGRSWEEVLQQIRQQSVDLMLICLSDSTLNPSVLAALKALSQRHDLPPVLVLDQRLGQGEIRQQFHHHT